jgi:hypothetical protein
MQDLRNIGLHAVRYVSAIGHGRLQKPFFSRMQLAVEREDDVEIAGKKRSQPMIDTDQIVSRRGFINLVGIGRDDTPQDRIVSAMMFSRRDSGYSTLHRLWRTVNQWLLLDRTTELRIAKASRVSETR